MSSPHKTRTAVHGEQGGILTRVRQRAPAISRKPGRREVGSPGVAAKVSLRQLNLLRVGYLILGGGLAVVKWPPLFTHGPWELKEGPWSAFIGISPRPSGRRCPVGDGANRYVPSA
jgi:hypothetical protein